MSILHHIKISLVILSLSIGHFSVSQNLVPNPSFEVYGTCPNEVNTGSPDEVAKATGWFSSRGTPDYYNTCATLSSLVSIPYNVFGYQMPPASENAYCGFKTFFTTGYREIIGAQLLSQLVIGQKYSIFFKLNRANPIGIGGNYCNCATDKIGVRFSTIPYNISNPVPIDNFAHVYTTSIITDTINWVAISGSFVADSVYKYLNIGNFFDDYYTDTVMYNTIPCQAYYYIDDISVVEIDSTNLNDSSDCKYIFVPNAFSPNNDGQNDLECIYSNCISTVYFAIYDRWGEKVFETTDTKDCWDGTFKDELMNTGVFVYKLDATLIDGTVVERKGNINLFR